MPRPGVAVSNQVIARNNLGQFIADVEEAATQTVSDAIEEGAKLSREIAPRGRKDDPRTDSLVDSIKTELTGRTSGRWYSDARHALPQEFGARPHDIRGNPRLEFFWEREGRRWIPASVLYRQPGLVDVVHHPGNRPQPFLRPAYEIVQQKLMEIARKNYPG